MDVKILLIEEDCTLLDAMTMLSEAARKILFVVVNNEFKASLTDGDIRRWILKKGKLDAKIKEFANYNPKYLYESQINEAKKIMEKHRINAIPILNSKNEVISVAFRYDDESVYRKTMDIPIVIMAGGLGTRLYPYTKILPKPLIPIGEIPIIEHIINRFHQYGNKDFYLVVNHKKNMIKAYFNEVSRNYNINYADEIRPLGTGGGLSLLKDKISSTFIFSNCDILIEDDYQKMYDYHIKEKNLITMIVSLKNITIPYGVVEISKTGEIEKMIEKPVHSIFINTGMYIVEPDVIMELEDNKNIGFPDIIEEHRKKGRKVGVYPVSENAWLDMGQLSELEEVKRKFEFSSNNN